MSSTTIPRLVVAGTASGTGKTTVTVGLIGALRARGLRVAAFKGGPDYLDPTYHARATGAPCHNLDGWMMGKDAVRATFARASAGADVAIVEGVMGVFDGASPTGDAGSTAELARWLDAPVLVVIDASGMARTIAAIAGGLAAFDPDLRVAGVIANQVGSRGHLELLRKALARPPVLGGLPDEPALAFPARHLGLVAADRGALPDARFAAWAERGAGWFDLDAILALARSAPALPPAAVEAAPGPTRCRLAIAADAAFHFYYEDNLRRLEAAGALLVPFSPLTDATLPAVDGVYLGGGYPELHAAALSENRTMHASLAGFAAAGGPIYAECGGLMYLCEAICTRDGRRHPMVGLLPGEAVMGDRLAALGYVEVETQARSALGAPGLRFRGHQFRYSELRGVPDDVERIYRVRRRRDDATSAEGYRRGSVLGSYVHAHWASNPAVATGLVAACVEHASRAARRAPGTGAQTVP
ncbi:MAG TPA: cobyrinate a,c-diamide synthase [Kofleriaceae bacterium]|nr:cobyrinate a,c-diamide synthase [Kofleriaceae bacterium]